MSQRNVSKNTQGKYPLEDQDIIEMCIDFVTELLSQKKVDGIVINLNLRLH